MSANQRYKTGELVVANDRTWEVLAYVPPDMYRLRSHGLEGTIRTPRIQPASEQAKQEYAREEAERLARRR